MDLYNKPSVFDPHSEPSSIQRRWKTWLADFELFIVAADITNDARKKAALLNLAGREVTEIFRNLPEGEVGTTYSDLKTALNKHFTPTVNPLYEVFKFRGAKQEPTETFKEYYMRLRGLSATCEFGNSLDKELLIQVLCGTTSTRLRKEILKKPSITLAEALVLGESEEQVALQAKAFDDVPPEALHVNKVKSGTHNSTEHTCYACGGLWPHPGEEKCPALGVKCAKCSKYNHLPQFCKSKKNGSKPNRFKKKVNNVKEQINDTSSDSDVTLNLNVIKGRLPSVKAKLLGRRINMIVDTGSSVDIINIDQYKQLNKAPKLEKHHKMLMGYQCGKVETLGQFTANVEYKNKSVKAKIVVVTSGDALIGHNTAQQLGIVKLTFQMLHQPVTKFENKSTGNDLIQRYPEVFKGVGKLRNLQVKLHIDPSVPPAATSHGRIPFHLKKHLESEVQKLLENDIIEKVNGPTSWVSPARLVPKADSSDYRLCVDMRLPNKAIIRERHPLPTVDDIFVTLNGAKWFSKLDLAMGFHQCELHEDSRYITTFTTHLGLFRYKRLSFGINSAPEKFNEIVRQALAGIDNVINVSDDILVYSNTEEDHDRALITVLERLRDLGLTVNPKKCVFKKRKVRYVGYILSGDGIQADPRKVEAVMKLDPPRDVSEVRSVLGMVNFLARFIPNLANATKPLRDLTSKKVTWRWGAKEKSAFLLIKKLVEQHVMNCYFDINKICTLYVDAGPEGLGALLTQNKNDEDQIVACASCSLNCTQKKYSQIEKEMLAVTWAVDRFKLYLLGKDFIVKTDHRPLVSLISKNKPATARLERMKFKLLGYNFTVQYIPGKLNPADYMSRHPVKPYDGEDDVDFYVNSIISLSLPDSMNREEIVDATKKDQVLQKVMCAIKTQDWSDPEIYQFKGVKDELSISQDPLLLRGHRIIIPAVLQQRVIKLAHLGHQGVTKTKELLRCSVWFPELNKAVEAVTSKCLPCLVSTPRTSRDPIRPTPTPPAPWENLSIDFAGPYPNGKYVLVLIDEYSKFPIVEVINSVSAGVVNPLLFKIFAIFGLPKQIKSDGGPPFNGEHFRTFCEKLGVYHKKITPLWPEANGRVEHFMVSLNKTIRTMILEEKSWELHLPEFLIQYRATPHSATRIPPARALLRTNFKSFLPHMPQVLFEDEVDEVLRKNDALSKEKMKNYADARRSTKPHTLVEGDKVLIRQPKQDKYTTPYDPRPLDVVTINGSQVTVKRDDQLITRNASMLKKIPETASEIPLSSPSHNNIENQHLDSLNQESLDKVVSPVKVEADTEDLLRPSRQRRLPARLKDFVLD